MFPSWELSDLRDQYPVEQLRDSDNLKNLYLYDSDYIVPEPELFDLDSFLDCFFSAILRRISV